MALKRPSASPPEGPLTEVLRTRNDLRRVRRNAADSAPLGRIATITQSGPAAPLRERMRLNVFRDQHDGQSASNRSGTCGHQERQYRQRQISKARQTSIGSAFVLRPRYLAVLSILAWPKSARTVCKSPVPFKMWRAFVRRKDSTL